MSKELVYSSHLELRLRLRSIGNLLPRKIFECSKERYFDKETGLFVGVGRAKYRGRIREFAVVYKEREDDILLITIHPLKIDQKKRRVLSGRWQKQ